MGGAGGGGGGKVERHPERRVKSAWKEFQERELPKIQEEMPGLKLKQYNHHLQKRWKKSPENPMNQTHLAYNEKPGGKAAEED